MFNAFQTTSTMAVCLVLLGCFVSAQTDEQAKPGGDVELFKVSGVVLDSVDLPVANSVVIPLSENGVPLSPVTGPS